jgi:hypothetical protein
MTEKTYFFNFCKQRILVAASKENVVPFLGGAEVNSRPTVVTV